jgi:drug/metabolite transporter (DMT)-like permease
MSRLTLFVNDFARIPAAIQAAFLMVIACFFLGGLGGLIRHLADSGMPVFEIVFLRTLAGVIVFLPWFFKNGIMNVLPKRPGLLLARGVCGFAAMATWFFAVSLIPLADAVALNFTAPLFATLLAVLILKEKVRMRRGIALLIGFAGAMIILRPGMIELNNGVIATLVSALFMACTVIFVKILAKSDSVTSIVAWNQIMILPMTAIPVLFVWQTPTLEQLGWVVIMGVAATIGHLCFTRSYAIAEATYVMPFDFFRLIFSAIIGYIFFDQISDIYTWIGGAIIFVSAVYIAYRETVAGNTEAIKQASPAQIESVVKTGLVK